MDYNTSWPCPRCTFENKNPCAKCLICLLPRFVICYYAYIASLWESVYGALPEKDRQANLENLWNVDEELLQKEIDILHGCWDIPRHISDSFYGDIFHIVPCSYIGIGSDGRAIDQGQADEPC